MTKVMFFLFGCLFLAMSCNYKTKPYLQHKMTSEKIQENCDQYERRFRMERNAIGERYEFQKCLNATYDGHYTIERRGDTVVARFTKADGPQSLFRIILDIDSYPAYQYLTIDEETFVINVEN